MGVFGDTLRQARAQKGVTLKEAEQATRINRHHLAALEEENFTVLPPLIYQRGILRNYAAFLDLEPGKLLAMFEEARGGSPGTEVAAAMRPLDMPNHWAPNFAIIAFMVVMSAIIFAWIYSTVFNQAAADATQVPTYPTVTPIPTPTLDDPLPLPAIIPASPTNSLPSATATATARVLDPAAPIPTSTPLATATAVPSPSPVPSPTEAPTQVSVAQEPQEVPTEPPAPEAATGDTATIRVLAQGDIDVTIVADGATVYSGWLGAGTVTEWYTASEFQVTTSNGGLTLFENAAYPDWDPFLMGEGEYVTFTLTP